MFWPSLLRTHKYKTFTWFLVFSHGLSWRLSKLLEVTLVVCLLANLRVSKCARYYCYLSLCESNRGKQSCTAWHTVHVCGCQADFITLWGTAGRLPLTNRERLNLPGKPTDPTRLPLLPPPMWDFHFNSTIHGQQPVRWSVQTTTSAPATEEFLFGKPLYHPQS